MSTSDAGWNNYTLGSIGWAPGPGPLWGPKGARVTIDYVLDQDRYPKLVEALKRCNNLKLQFDVLLKRKPKRD